MKNQKELLGTQWHEAPDISIAPCEKYYYTDYNGKKQCRKSKNYLYGCNVLEGGELVLTIYEADKKPLFRSIVTRYEFKSQYYKDEKPSDSTIENYLSGVLHFYRCYAKMATDEASREVVKNWLNDNKLVPLRGDETPIKAVKDVQSDIRKRALERKHDKIRKSIDDNMLEIRPVPARIEKWVDDVVLKDSRYILYEYSGRKLQDGTCTHCKAEVKVESAKNGKCGKCPNCGSEVKYISKGRARVWFDDNRKYAYIQPDKNGEPIFRYFEVTRHFYLNGNAYITSEYTVEHHRYFYAKNKKYSYENFMQTGEHRFCNASGIPSKWGYIYPYNMKAVFKEASKMYQHIKYIPMTKMLNSVKQELDLHYFYVNIIERPIIEYLAKLKLYGLCSAVINGFTQNDYFDATADNLKEVFPEGVTRDELRFFAKLDLTPHELTLYHAAKDVKQERFEKALELERNHDIGDRCIKYLKYTSPEKLFKYLKSMPEIYSWGSITATKSNDWADYIEMAEKLKWDLKDDFVLFPKNFWEAHDRANNLVKIENVKKQNEAVAKWAKVLDKEYRMNGKEFFIRAAATAEEIVVEGQKMHHCVANYVGRVAKGETGILFMRSIKEPDKPLYTIEVRDGKVIQCRGKNNRDMDKENEKAFFRKWKAAKFKEESRKAG